MKYIWANLRNTGIVKIIPNLKAFRKKLNFKRIVIISKESRIGLLIKNKSTFCRRQVWLEFGLQLPMAFIVLGNDNN